MEYAEVLQDKPLLVRTLKLTLPFALVATEVTFLYFFLDYPSFLLVIGLMVAYILPPAGKETVIPAGIFLGIPWWLMAISIMMIDIETALFMGWNFDLALKIPVLGRIMESFIEKAGVFIKERALVKKSLFYRHCRHRDDAGHGQRGNPWHNHREPAGYAENTSIPCHRHRCIHRLFRHRARRGISAGTVHTKHPVGYCGVSGDHHHHFYGMVLLEGVSQTYSPVKRIFKRRYLC